MKAFIISTMLLTGLVMSAQGQVQKASGPHEPVAKTETVVATPSAEVKQTQQPVLLEYAYMAAGKGGVQVLLPDGTMKSFEYVKPPRGFDPYTSESYRLNTMVTATYLKVINEMAKEGWLFDKVIVNGGVEAYYLSRPLKQ